MHKSTQEQRRQLIRDEQERVKKTRKANPVQPESNKKPLKSQTNEKKFHSMSLTEKEISIT